MEGLLVPFICLNRVYRELTTTPVGDFCRRNLELWDSARMANILDDGRFRLMTLNFGPVFSSALAGKPCHMAKGIQQQEALMVRALDLSWVAGL